MKIKINLVFVGVFVLGVFVFGIVVLLMFGGVNFFFKL